MLGERTFGDRLILIMRDKRLSNKGLGMILGLTGQSVGKWIAGGEIDQDNLIRLAEALDVNWVWLRYGAKAYESVCEKRAEDIVAQERRKWVEEVKVSEMRHRIGMRLAGVGSWEWKAADDSLIWSDQMLNVFEIERDAFPGNLSHLGEYMSERDCSNMRAMLTDCVFGKIDLYDSTHRIITGAGREKWVQMKGVLCGNGGVISVIGACMDVTHSASNECMSEG